MAELITLARPYARAAFEQALATKALPAWTSALATAAGVSAEPRVASLIASPSLTATQKADVLIGVCGDDALPVPARNFIRVLAENKRLPLLPQVHELFLALKAAQEQSVDLEVTSAFEIAPEQATLLADVIGKKLQRTVRVSSSVDKALIGGVVIRTADMVIDGSVRGRLAKLSEAMNS
ncbi:MAG TPA: F0F1 ATP synthase subunit delta [Pseudomonadales bacterium]|nr:F0F1 ATP synthase subunit delta [Pseudomonadales bacterium]HNC69038.1 F0F1 ATP synthase subunit delta [Pseudomonadales bacterium]